MVTNTHTTNTAPAKLAALAVPVPHLDGSRAVFDNQTWLRLPRAGSRCNVSGLSRSGLCDLVRPNSRNDYAPPVASRLLKRKGAARGVLLINRQSLLDFINEQPAPTRADLGETPLPAGKSRAEILAELQASGRRMDAVIKAL